jgi:hypothetical protein
MTYWLEYASWVPSGDHVGWMSVPTVVTTGVTFVPSAFIT